MWDFCLILNWFQFYQKDFFVLSSLSGVVDCVYGINISMFPPVAMTSRTLPIATGWVFSCKGSSEYAFCSDGLIATVLMDLLWWQWQGRSLWQWCWGCYPWQQWQGYSCRNSCEGAPCCDNIKGATHGNSFNGAPSCNIIEGAPCVRELRAPPVAMVGCEGALVAKWQERSCHNSLKGAPHCNGIEGAGLSWKWHVPSPVKI